MRAVGTYPGQFIPSLRRCIRVNIYIVGTQVNEEKKWPGWGVLAERKKSAPQNFNVKKSQISLDTLTMAPPSLKKRKLEDNHSRNPKKSRKQEYHSSPSASPSPGEDEIPAVNLADSDEDAETHAALDTLLPLPVEEVGDNQTSESDSDSDTDSNSSQSQLSNPNHTKISRQKSKRNDPDAFASSISAILSSKLSTSKRNDPVLARSATAAEANASIANSKLESKARQKLRADKKEALEKGRVKDVLGVESGDVGAVIDEEKRLRKTAQRGVVKLFNAVRGAQVRAEEARKGTKGTRGRVEEKVAEMSKKGFLEMVAGGGKGGEIEEG